MRAALVIVAAAAALLVTSGCTAVEQAERPATPTPTAGTPGDATPTVTPPDGEPTPTPTATGTEPARDVAVVVDTDGRVVAVDAATGDEIRELLDGVRVDDPAGNDIAVTPDAATAFVVVPPDQPPGPSELVRVPIAGGDTETLTEGTMPAVSPDGATLAYVAFEQPDDPRGLPQPALVLRDLDSGQETRLSREEPFHFIPDVEWTADGSQVVFTAGEINTGLYAVNRDAASLDEARRLGPELQGDDAESWGPVAAFGQGRLAVVETTGDPPHTDRWAIIAVEVADGTSHGDLLPDERIQATHLDSDADAARLLIVAGGGPEGGELLRWDGDGDPEQIAEDIIVAAW